VLEALDVRLKRPKLPAGRYRLLVFEGLTMDVAIYARVSTNNGQNPEMQLAELREYCLRRNWKVLREYVDVGISGTKVKRPELDQLMADANRRRFDALVVWRFDRFARSVSHLLRALEDFRALGIEFISLSENVDTSTPTGKMVFTVLGAVAELERSLIVERVRAGLRNARAKGKKLGRPRKVSNPGVIGQMRSQGASWRVIGKTLGISHVTARSAATRLAGGWKEKGTASGTPSASLQ
jgi:DNA invertase Pin-like site-specific DNA recombinase